MIVHYLVIWMLNGNMSTRKETPMDLLLEDYEIPAEERYKMVLLGIADKYNVTDLMLINIINICRL